MEVARQMITKSNSLISFLGTIVIHSHATIRVSRQCGLIPMKIARQMIIKSKIPNIPQAQLKCKGARFKVTQLSRRSTSCGEVDTA